MKQRDSGGVTTGVLATILGLVLLAGVGVASWQFGWWLEAKNAEKAAQVRDNAPNAQRGYRQAARDAIEVVLDPDSSTALVTYNTTIACENIASLDDAFLTEDLEAFAFINCP